MGTLTAWQSCRQFGGDHGCEQPAMSLMAMAVAAHRFEVFGEGDELGDVMHRTGGVADRALRMLPVAFTAATATRILRRSLSA